MFGGVRHLFAAYAVLLFLILAYHTCSARRNNVYCAPSSCGNIHNISYPFRLKSDPQNCGNTKYELKCEKSARAVLHLMNTGKYYVQAINYENFTIRLVDADVQKDNCSSIPRHSSGTGVVFEDERFYPWYQFLYGVDSRRSLVFMKCANPVRSPIFVDYTSSCDSGTYNFSVPPGSRLKDYTYVMVGGNYSDLIDSCKVDWMLMTSLLPNDFSNISYTIVRDSMVYGFELSWFQACCESKENRCNLDDDSLYYCDSGESQALIRVVMDFLTHRILQYLAIWPLSKFFPPNYDWIAYTRWGKPQLQISSFTVNYNWTVSSPFWSVVIVLLMTLLAFIVIYRAVLFICGIPCLVTLLVYKWRRRHLSMYDMIEKFLQSHNNLMPVRYSYSEIKKITEGFKDKLDEGGCGSVYKGKLRSARFAAVKILDKSKANGQEFINEVATIGRIHHVNVVQLIGFCAENSKQALIYEFMPNGSLDKFIFSKEGSIPLSNEKIFQISLGVARGIEYLHRGCDMQILHFDIKPHNILLDEKFIPKVSDFGLAKLYSTNDRIVSLTAARGTMGYMAPELFYKNIGGISYKADVYSFGMLLMEMVGRRKNVNAFADHLSQIYFPSWVYDQVIEGKDIELGNATEQEKRTTKTMIIVALWCIQLKPDDRPSMHKVVQMLEMDIQCLEIPPKPFLTPQQMSKNDDRLNMANLTASPSNDCIDSLC